MTTGTILTNTVAATRKRSRPLQRRCRSCLVVKTLPILALLIVLALSTQANALSISSSAVGPFDIQLEEEPTCKAFDHVGEKDVVDVWEHEDEDFDEHEIEEFDEEDEEWDDEDEDWDDDDYEYDDLEEYDEDDEEEEEDDELEYDGEDYEEEDEFEEEEYEYEEGVLDEDEGEDDIEDDDHEDDLQDEEDEEYWTPEEEKEMDLLYSRYLEEVELAYGANWRDEYELVVDKEEIYVRFLEFEERRKQEREADLETDEREAEERRIVTQATHKVLIQHEEAKQNRTEEQAADFVPSKNDAMAAGLPPPRDMVVINTGVSYYNYNIKKEDAESSGAECSTSRNPITTRREDSQSFVGSS